MRMIESWRRLLRLSATVVLGLFLLLSGYRYHESMAVARSFEVNAPELDRRVLIATQGSRFKEAVVDAVVSRLRQRPVYIKVIDLSLLGGVQAAEWSALVVLHTWENWNPQLAAKRFVRRANAPEKVVVLATSDDGEDKMAGVDAITATEVEEAPPYAEAILARLEPLLQ
jgi:hypothetical protein